VRPLKVLIADDTEGLRAVLRAVLESLGHQVTEAADGQQAVEAARRGDFDLALLDLEMPLLDGGRALTRIAAATPGTACVLMTASTDGRRVAAALGRGARACLRKPFSLKALEAILLEIAAPREGEVATAALA